MGKPVVFISHFKVKEGSLLDLKRLSADVIADLYADKPRTVLWLAYLDEEGTEISFIHAFPDADSMDAHFGGVEERVAAAYRYLEPQGWEIFGKPSEAAMETMQQAASSSGVSLTVLPEHLGGFLRLRPA
jgi:hypothetical protein